MQVQNHVRAPRLLRSANPRKLFMRFIIHDWVGEDCLRILKLIRDVMLSEVEGGRSYIVDSVLRG